MNDVPTYQHLAEFLREFPRCLFNVVYEDYNGKKAITATSMQSGQMLGVHILKDKIEFKK